MKEANESAEPPPQEEESASPDNGSKRTNTIRRKVSLDDLENGFPDGIPDFISMSTAGTEDENTYEELLIALPPGHAGIKFVKGSHPPEIYGFKPTCQVSAQLRQGDKILAVIFPDGEIHANLGSHDLIKHLHDHADVKSRWLVVARPEATTEDDMMEVSKEHNHHHHHHQLVVAPRSFVREEDAHEEPKKEQPQPKRDHREPSFFESNRTCIIIGAAILLLLAIILAIALPLSLRSKGINHSDDSNSEHSCGVPLEGNCLVNLIRSASPQTTFPYWNAANPTAPTSPQERALQWMLQDSYSSSSSLSDNRLLQRFALVTLYYSTNLNPLVPTWGIVGWLEPTNECKWSDMAAPTGVKDIECDSKSYVTELDLDLNGLMGSIPREIFFLSHLRDLELSNNLLTGPIPPEMGLMTSLEYLWLFQNTLSGTIPSQFGNLKSLIYLDLNTNAFSGDIPPELANLKSLRHLKLHGTFVSGTLPSSLCPQMFSPPSIICGQIHCNCCQDSSGNSC